MLELKRHFSRSIGRPGAPLHFAAHSHHPWPDVTFAAQQQAWLDAAELLDRKWEKIFAEVIPEAQRHVAGHLKLPDPTSIVFGPNTHSFLLRILSSLDAVSGVNVISTDGEFHSFTRQMDRLVEADLVNLVRVPVEPFATFKERFIAELKTREDWDLVWLSHVFFNSGFVLPHNDLIEFCAAVPASRNVCRDRRLSRLHGDPGRAFGHGWARVLRCRRLQICDGRRGRLFLHCPPGYGERPRDTGWYAEFGALGGARGDEVAFGNDGSRFAGATFDPRPLSLQRCDGLARWPGLECRRHGRLLCRSAETVREQARRFERRYFGERSDRARCRRLRAISHLAHAGRGTLRSRTGAGRHHGRSPRRPLAHRLRHLSGSGRRRSLGCGVAYDRLDARRGRASGGRRRHHRCLQDRKAAARRWPRPGARWCRRGRGSWTSARCQVHSGASVQGGAHRSANSRRRSLVPTYKVRGRGRECGRDACRRRVRDVAADDDRRLPATNFAQRADHATPEIAAALCATTGVSPVQADGLPMHQVSLRRLFAIVDLRRCCAATAPRWCDRSARFRRVQVRAPGATSPRRNAAHGQR